MVRCPFCHKQMRTQKEPEFRSHLRTECEEAPREVNRHVTDWQEELADEMAEFIPEEDDEEEARKDTSERPDDAPGEVLPV
jgi:hypothetical protein